MSRRVEPYPARRPATPADGPEPRRSPPPAHAHVMQHDPRAPPPPPPHHYAYSMPRDYHSAYMYATQQQHQHPQHPPPHTYGHDDRYAAYAPPPPAPYMPHGAYMAYPTGAPAMPPQGASPFGAPANGGGDVTYTDDAGTKLSSGVRRRCFNCCTKDTSTWRRSNLAAGKVLCNKCGLFERTHSRPRPEQFPHKRGPLAYSTVRSNEGTNGPIPGQAQYPPPTSASGPPGGPNSGNPSPYAAYLTTMAGPHPPMAGLLPEAAAASDSAPATNTTDNTAQNQTPSQAPTPSNDKPAPDSHDEAGKPNDREGQEIQKHEHEEKHEQAKHEDEQDADGDGDGDADAEREGE